MSNIPNAPITNFSHCHEGILRQLKAMEALPAQALAAERARQAAESTRNFFRDVIFNHHEEEERVLFEAVLASAEPGAELAHVKVITDRLTREHRQIEALWAKLEPQLKKMAKGQSVAIDLAAMQQLVNDYQAHAAFEEALFLPLSETILSRNSNHMAALGLSLHVRHITQAPSPT
ncbi:hemerythrin domain-containing protein [Rhodoferax sp.]|uniref:hemerythrin domain-containing protein n=1 Tax=Rhodoferax sp. TaxID=50421 RepID=UPI0025D7B19C|nr:hemerythrin domain-containing protein [Rhodoferax sp.]MCM2296707.1 hemerythrin domain-containing protein [Rhodoferax sp.]